jgi:hypothetical protein
VRKGAGVPGDPRAGVILPAALLLLLGGTLMAASLLVTSRSAVLLSEGDRHLARSLAVRSPVPPAPDDGVRPLSRGFLLVSGPAPGASWHLWAAGWRLDPVRVADGLRAAAETGRGVVGEGGEVLGHEGTPDGAGSPGDEGEACGDPGPLPAHWLDAGPRDPRPDPPLAPFPRLGPVGLGVVSERGEVLLQPGTGLPGRDSVVVVAPAGLRVEGGAGSGLLVGLGDLQLGGDSRFRGLVLVAGDLILEGGTSVTGAVRVGGELRFEGGGRVEGCRRIVRKNLASLPALEAPFPLPGGAVLGRH